MKRYLWIFITILFFSPHYLIAAPIDLPLGFSEDITENNCFSLTTGLDSINKMKLEKNDSDVSGTIVSVKGLYSSPNSVMDIYIDLGQLKSAKYKFTSGNKVELVFDDQFAYGVGVNSVLNLAEIDEILGASIFFDAKIRRIEDIRYAKASVNEISYNEDAFSNSVDAKWIEQQLAIGLVKKIKYGILYGGTKYTSVRVTAKISIAGTMYDLSKNTKDRKFGGFIGFRIPFKNMNIGLEGRFVDEKAFDIKANFRF